MDERQKDLSCYRIAEAADSLKVASHCLKEVFPLEIGRKLGTLQRVREKSDYDDFYIASREKAEEQFQTAELVIGEVKKYLEKY